MCTSVCLDRIISHTLPCRLSTDRAIIAHLKETNKKIPDKGGDGGTEWYGKTTVDDLQLIIGHAIYLVDAEFSAMRYGFTG